MIQNICNFITYNEDNFDFWRVYYKKSSWWNSNTFVEFVKVIHYSKYLTKISVFFCHQDQRTSRNRGSTGTYTFWWQCYSQDLDTGWHYEELDMDRRKREEAENAFAWPKVFYTKSWSKQEIYWIAITIDTCKPLPQRDWSSGHNALG